MTAKLLGAHEHLAKVGCDCSWMVIQRTSKSNTAPSKQERIMVGVSDHGRELVEAVARKEAFFGY